MNPINGFLRFLLELLALIAMGWWGSELIEGAGRYALMIGLPLVAAVIWGMFAVPGDPSRGKDGVVRVSGLVRLLLEAVFFGFAGWCLWSLGKSDWAIGFGVAVVLHYALSGGRLKWLLAPGI